MGQAPRSGVILVTFAVLVALSAATPQSRTEYRTKDGSTIVVVTAKKPNPEAGQESVVEFYSPENQRLCTLDFSSTDGEHGFGLVKAAWTADGRYFVFSLTSSGGHQSWHAPTFFYSAREGQIRSLDDYIDGYGISNGDFRLRAPDIMLTEMWRGETVPLRFRLDSLTKGPRKARHTVQCTGGKTIREEG
jgi:hypothetical protein